MQKGKCRKGYRVLKGKELEDTLSVLEKEGFIQRVAYRVMTDEHGQRWDVPVTEDLRKHKKTNPKHWMQILRKNHG